MRVRLARKYFLAALRAIKDIAPAKGGAPIIPCVRITVGMDDVFLDGTDLTTSVRVQLPLPYGSGAESIGTRAVDVRRLIDVVRLLTEEDVELTGDGPFGLKVSTPSSLVSLEGHDPEDFPMAPRLAPGDVYHHEVRDLREAIEKTSFAMSKDAARAQLQCIAFTGTHAVASDGKRLAEFKFPTNGKAMLPRRAVAPLLKICKLEDKKGDVTIRIDEAQKLMAIRFRNARISTRTVEGQMPDYQALIPKDFDSTIYIDDVEEARRRVTISGANQPKDKKVVTLVTREEDGCVSLQNETYKGGLPGASARGKVLRAAFTVPFLVDGLRAGGKVLRLGLQVERGAAVMWSENWRYAFMPVMQEVSC